MSEQQINEQINEHQQGNPQQMIQFDGQIEPSPEFEGERINPTKKIQKGRIKRQLNRLRTEDFDIFKRLKMQKKFCTKLSILCKNLQNQLWIILEEPESSFFALFIQYILLIGIFFSCVVIIYDSLIPEDDNQLNTFSKYSETVLFFLFSCEYFFRLATSTAFDNKLVSFLVSPMNLADLLAILPFILNLLFENSSLSQLKIIRAVRFLRVFRVFKISRYIKGINLLSVTIRKSFKDLFVLAYLFFVLVMVFSTLIYYVEKVGESFEIIYTEKQKINTMTDAIWWCFVTMTTIGYGDKVPFTIEGKFIACICAFFGITIISLPVAVLGVTFSSALSSDLEAVEVNKIKQELTENFQNFQNKEQLDLKELEFMQQRLDLLYENNAKIIDLVETSQQLFDEVTQQLISLFTILTKEFDLHLDEHIKSMRAKDRVMKLEKDNYVKNNLDLQMIASKLREQDDQSKKMSRSILGNDDDSVSRRVRRKSVRESFREKRKIENSVIASQKLDQSKNSPDNKLSKSPITRGKNASIQLIECLESDKSPQSFIMPVDQKVELSNFLELDLYVRKTNKTVPSFVGAGLEVLNEIEGDELSNKIANLKNQESEDFLVSNVASEKLKKKKKTMIKSSIIVSGRSSVDNQSLINPNPVENH